jgi:hypothetical protein
MADQVKEIFAGTISASDVATGSTTLFTTDANTQYVIKDVQVSSSFLGAPKLAVNNFDVASLAGSVTGSEIVDVSSTAKYKISDTAPVFKNDIQTALSTTYTKNNTTQLLVNGVSSGDPVTTTTATGFSSLNEQAQTVMYAVASNGDIYYGRTDGNSSQSIRKQTVSGVNSQVVSMSYGWSVFDGNETIYYCGASTFGSTVLKKFNINTQVTTQVNLGSPFCSSSYPHGVMTNNGKIACIHSGEPYGVFLIDPIANTVTSVGGMGSFSSSGTGYNIAAYYDETTNRYTFWRRTSNTLFKSIANNEIVIGSSYTGGCTNNTGNIASTSINSSEILYNYARGGDGSFIQFKDNFKETYTLNPTTSAVTTTKVDNYLPYNILYGFYYEIQKPITASEITKTVDVRVTGVKTTL